MAVLPLLGGGIPQVTHWWSGAGRQADHLSQRQAVGVRFSPPPEVRLNSSKMEGGMVWGVWRDGTGGGELMRGVAIPAPGPEAESQLGLPLVSKQKENKMKVHFFFFSSPSNKGKGSDTIYKM